MQTSRLIVLVDSATQHSLMLYPKKLIILSYGNKSDIDYSLKGLKFNFGEVCVEASESAKSLGLIFYRSVKFHEFLEIIRQRMSHFIFFTFTQLTYLFLSKSNFVKIWFYRNSIIVIKCRAHALFATCTKLVHSMHFWNKNRRSYWIVRRFSIMNSLKFHCICLYHRFIFQNWL